MRAILLTRDKKAKIKKVNAKRNDWEYEKSVYILDSKRVQNFRDKDDGITGTELIFFEDNPNPVSWESDPKDLSSDYLDNIVMINFIQQTTDTFGKWNAPNLGFVKWFFEDVSRIPFVLMVGFVLWTIVKNFIAGGI